MRFKLDLICNTIAKYLNNEIYYEESRCFFSVVPLSSKMNFQLQRRAQAEHVFEIADFFFHSF